MIDNLWNFISIINDEYISEDETELLKDIDFGEVADEYLRLRAAIFEKIKHDNMDDADIKFWNSKIDSFIFEGKRIVSNNIKRDKEELCDYIMTIMPLKFDVNSFLYGLKAVSMVKNVSRRCK